MPLFYKMIPLVTATILLLTSPVLAQEASNANMEILAQKIKADKKLVVAMNMNLSDAEAKGFWPVYNNYQADLQKVNQRLGALISDYADAYNSGSISDDTAGKLIKEWLQAEAEEMKLRVANVKKLAKVL
ncbi:MAG: hypothetical protein ACE1ZK_00510, partial [Nitrospirales bacterium]